MAIITAQASGNWSAGGTWAGGVAPGSGDTARPSTYTVDIDQDITCVLLETTTTGFFRVPSGLSGARVITANVQPASGGSSCLRLQHTSGNSVRVDGNISANTVTTSSDGCQNNSTGSLTVNGNVTGGTTSSLGINGAGSGSITVNGNVTGGTAGAGIYVSAAVAIGVTGTIAAGGSGAGVQLNHASSVLTHTGSVNNAGVAGNGIYMQTAATCTISGDVTAGTGTTTYGVKNEAAGTVTISGNVTGGSGTNGYGVYNQVTGTITINGTCTGGTGSNAHGAYNDGAGTITVNTAVGNNFGVGGGTNLAVGVYGDGTTGQITKVYKVKYGAYGMAPTGGSVLLVNDVSNTAEFRTAYNGATKTLDPAPGGGVSRSMVVNK